MKNVSGMIGNEKHRQNRGRTGEWRVMNEVVDESKNNELIVRENELMAGMSQGGYDVWNDY